MRSLYFFNWKLLSRPPSSVNTARYKGVSTTTSLAGRAVGGRTGAGAAGAACAATGDGAEAGAAGWAAVWVWGEGGTGRFSFSPKKMKAINTTKLKARAIKARLSIETPKVPDPTPPDGRGGNDKGAG